MSDTYNQEADLLLLVRRLVDKYTSGDSRSVTYETVQMLFNAIEYTIHMTELKNATNTGASFKQYSFLSSKDELSESYMEGKKLLDAHIQNALDLYLRLMENYDDYGIPNYKDTVIRGLKSFFQIYDPLFRPQEHRLTLDYPILNDHIDLVGILRIEHYILGLSIEQSFLLYFHRAEILSRLRGVFLAGPTLYMDNITYPVLMSVCASILVHKPVDSLAFFKGDIQHLARILDSMDLNLLVSRVRVDFRLLLKSIDMADYEDYFQSSLKDILFRLKHSTSPETLTQWLACQC